MADLLIDLSLLWALLAMAGVMTLGWGRLVGACVGLRRSARIESGAFWLGFVALLGAVECINIFIAVDWKVTLGCLAVGFAGCAMSGGTDFRGWISGLARRIQSRPGLALVVVALAIVWCLRSMGVPNNFDSGLYHFASIRWLNEQPVVPGIGNLHWRLALNQSFFGFAALLNVAPVWGKGYAAAGLFLLLLCFATILETCQFQTRLWCRLVGGLLVVYLGYLASGIVNPAPDGIVSIIQVAIFTLLFRTLLTSSGSAPSMVDGVALLSLCVGITMVKLSGLAFGATSVLLVLAVWRHAIQDAPAVRVRVAMLLGLILVVHLGRGYLLSGYPLFPSPVAGLPSLEWAVAPEVLVHESDLIRSWARAPGVLNPQLVLSGWHWLGPWAQGLPASVQMLYLASAVMTIAGIFSVMTGRLAPADRRVGALYAPLLAAALFWFLTAPDPRFLGAVPVLLIVLSAWIVTMSADGDALRTLVTRPASGSPFATTVVAIVVLASLKLTGLGSLSFTGWSALPVVPVQSRATEAGLQVLVPVEGGQCWNAPLPCVSIFNASVREGAWAPFSAGSSSALSRPAYYHRSPSSDPSAAVKH